MVGGRWPFRTRRTPNAQRHDDRGLKPSEKPQKLFDEKGLFLLLTPFGSRLWRSKYRFPIRRSTAQRKAAGAWRLSRGSLDEARENRDEARRDLRHGIDPGIKRRAEERSGADTFKAVALELFAILRKASVAGHGPPEAAAEVLERTIQSGRKRKARRREPISADLIGLLVPVEPEHMAAIVEPIKIGQLLRAIDGSTGQPLTRLALKLAPYIFPRPIEFRTMEWTNITLDGSSPEWRVPWRRMKMRKPHIVPLSRQAVVLLREIRVHSGRGRWVSHSFDA